MTVQTIVTPTGERLVVLPEADYRDLVRGAEDISDLAAVERFEHRLAAGDEELVPSDVVDRILSGENRVRVWREYRGMSAAALAACAEVAPDDLSAIERGENEGGVATLRRIATAMNLAIDDLVP